MSDRPLNQAIDPAAATYVVNIFWVGGGRSLLLDRAKLDQYNRDPDLYAARYCGFATAAEYREWLRTGGSALCSERTKSRRMCRAVINGGQLEPLEWQRQHRSRPCHIHARTGAAT